MARLDPTAILNDRETNAAALADLRTALAQPPATLLWMVAAATMTMLALYALILHGVHRAEADAPTQVATNAQPL